MARWAAPHRLDRGYRHAGIDGDNAALVGQHGIEIELAQLGQIGGQLRQLDQQQRDRAHVGSRDIAVGLEHARHAGARNQPARKPKIERRQRQRLVGDDLDCGPAAAEYDDRTEGRIVRNPCDQFARLRTQDHGMDGDAGNAGVRPGGSCARQDIRDGFAHRALAGEIKPHAADFGFVNDIRRQDLRDDGRTFRQQWSRDGQRRRPHRGRTAQAQSEWSRLQAGARLRSDRAKCAHPDGCARRASRPQRPRERQRRRA